MSLQDNASLERRLAMLPPSPQRVEDTGTAKGPQTLRVHPLARTTPSIRAEIQASTESISALARRFNVSEPTVAKWKARSSVADLSHRPHHLCTKLLVAQEALVIELRRGTLLPLDDLLRLARHFICADLSRAALDRCLRRYGVSNLRSLRTAGDTVAAPVQQHVAGALDGNQDAFVALCQALGIEPVPPVR